MFASAPRISRNLFLVLLAFILNNLASSLQYSVFINMPVPMYNMFNQSFFLHYGSYLSPIGASTIMSLSTMCGKFGELSAILFIAPLLDKLGRRFVAVHLRFVLLIIASILVLLATLLPSFECFVASFFFSALSFEIKFFATTLFITECTPDHIRGFVTMLQSIADVAGGVIGMTLSRPSIVGNEENWWQLGAIALIINILVASYLVWIPESPKRLVATGQRDKARKSLIYYHGKSCDAENLLDSYEKEIHVANMLPTMSWKDVWRDETIRKSVFLILSLYLAINLSPFVTEFMFSTLIQMYMGLSAESIMTLNSISRVLTLPLSFPASFAIDRWGRRPIIFTAFTLLSVRICLLMISFRMAKAVMMTFGLSYAFFFGPSTFTISIAIFNDILMAFVSALGIILICSLLVCELTPMNARVAVSQICNLVPAVTMIPFMVSLPIILNIFPPIIYIYPMFFVPPLAFYVYKNLPETKGRRVCDIIQDFDNCVRSRAPTRLSMISVDEYAPLLQRKKSHNFQ